MSIRGAGTGRPLSGGSHQCGDVLLGGSRPGFQCQGATRRRLHDLFFAPAAPVLLRISRISRTCLGTGLTSPSRWGDRCEFGGPVAGAVPADRGGVTGCLAPPGRVLRFLGGRGALIQGEVARRESARAHFPNLRLLRSTPGLGARAACAEPAAARGVERRRKITRQRCLSHGQIRIRLGDRLHPCTRVGVHGRCEQVVRRGNLAHLAEVHHDDAVAEILDDCQIVGNEQEC
jgi:hypothetical protein